MCTDLLVSPSLPKKKDFFGGENTGLLIYKYLTFLWLFCRLFLLTLWLIITSKLEGCDYFDVSEWLENKP